MECPYCERRCRLGEGSQGFCRMYHVEDGRVVERFPHKWCTYAVSRVEAIPFYHAYPGSRCLVIGTAGCNFDCRYCSNAYVAKEDPGQQQDIMLDLTPESLVKLAQKHGCHSIVFSINEPTVSLQSLLELSKAAKAAGLPMGCLTNGYSTPDATELLGEIFSFFNISLKGLAPRFCKKFLGIPDSAPVIRTIKQLAAYRHVEVVTPVIEEENDGELDEMASIIGGINPEMPWHVFRLLPFHKMSGEDYPLIEAINAKLQGYQGKLPHIYFHNFIGSEWVDTHCPDCGAAVITRHSLGCGGDKLDAYMAESDRCPKCGRGIYMLGGKVSWNSKEIVS